ncbi:MAG: glucan 1,4-alpha-glucosidase [Acidobacteria bacterium]|nr:MAG: glucan 1,4-alpha-glucosidase [Acidobacteriota bacterium]
MRVRCAVLFLSLVFPLLSANAQLAPGAPGQMAHWTGGNKQGVGTSNSLSSHVWFTLGPDGVLNEVYYPTVDKANTRLLEFVVTDGKSWVERESEDTTHQIEVPDTEVLSLRQVNTSKAGRYRITKTYITDPERDALLIQVRFQRLKSGPVQLYVLYDPSINNSGMHDTGYSIDDSLVASDNGIASALASSLPFTKTTSGYFGTSDGLVDLKKSFTLKNLYPRAQDGNVVQMAELPSAATRDVNFTIAVAFGSEGEVAIETAKKSLQKGYEHAYTEYAKGWRDWIGTLKPVDAKYRDQYQIAAMVMKAHEDKTYRGAGAASLTIPWGEETDADQPSVGGYHLIWARDLYEVATAFYAIGDKEAADRALNYLFNVQQKPDGSFPQNSWLDGRPFWGSLQMDEVSYPLILAWQLGRTDSQTYEKHVKLAANFIVKNGPSSPQERWEEQSGYSPSTIAAEIAGLVCAARIAQMNHDDDARVQWLNVADDWASKLESWTVTQNGKYSDRYFLRLSQHGQPNSGEIINIANKGGTWDEREIVDAGFLELVRLGIRSAGDPLIEKSLGVVDTVIKVDSPNGPVWYRYNHDGYGEQADGHGYNEVGIGRLWVLLVGERGEYAVASGKDPAPYLDAMQKMANNGHMLGEQVWDRKDSPDPNRFQFGEATGSATPLNWTCAQFVRLAVAAEDKRLPETPAIVSEHFAQRRASRTELPKTQGGTH